MAPILYTSVSRYHDGCTRIPARPPFPGARTALLRSLVDAFLTGRER